MRKFTEHDIRRALRGGLKFKAPVTETPSEADPFRAIIQAAGTPTGGKGRGRLTRKRFVKLVMSTGNQKREAEYLAYAAHARGVSYRDCLQWTMIPAILHADEAMKTMLERNRTVIPI